MTDLNQAREWADRVSMRPATDREHAAAEIIQSLPDQWVDAEKLRDVVDEYEGIPAISVIIQDFAALLNPKLPTLADMDEDDRHTMIGEDVNVEGWNNPSMLVAVHKNEGAVLAHNWINPWPFVEVRSLSELTPVNPTADQPARSSGSPKSPLPRPEGVPDPHPGEAWLVNAREGEQREALKAGNRWYIKDGDDVEEWVGEALTPISRLVPESPALPEGMRLADHEEYGRVVTSPWGDGDDDYKIFFLNEDTRGGADYEFAHESRLTFLDGEA